jgi:hypothetical protein
MQGRYDLTFSDPPDRPIAPFDTDGARSTLGVVCSAAMFYDAYTGGTAYVPALTAALVLMIASHWVIASVRMKWVVLFVLGASVSYHRTGGSWNGRIAAEERLGRPWGYQVDKGQS